MKKRLFSVAYMFLLTLFFTGLVSGIKAVNEKRIKINEDLKLQKIILQVFNGVRHIIIKLLKPFSSPNFVPAQ